MKKKALAIVLALTMAVLGGCSGGGSRGDKGRLRDCRGSRRDQRSGGRTDRCRRDRHSQNRSGRHER